MTEEEIIRTHTSMELAKLQIFPNNFKCFQTTSNVSKQIFPNILVLLLKLRWIRTTSDISKQLQIFPNKPIDQDEVHKSIFHMIFPFHELIGPPLLDYKVIKLIP